MLWYLFKKTRYCHILKNTFWKVPPKFSVVEVTAKAKQFLSQNLLAQWFDMRKPLLFKKSIKGAYKYKELRNKGNEGNSLGT